MADSRNLDRCEQNITDFYIALGAARALSEKGIELKDFSIQREGLFRVTDTWMRITNMTWQCYQVELNMENVYNNQITKNLNNPIAILGNCFSESFYIISALTA